jgi:pyruvate/2-oxoglutarate dehydrogenase complex dihydrolipoamide acyltransferase (E2) component
VLVNKMTSDTSHTIKPFSNSRKNITLIVGEGKRKHVVYALLEFDVTDAKHKMTQVKQHGKDISFTGWLVKCVSQAVSEHKDINCYRQGKHKIIQFTDVDIPITMERDADGERRPVPYIIRKTQTKTVEEITEEIRQAQQQEIDENSQVLGLKLARWEHLILKAPLSVKKLVLRLLRYNGRLKQQYMGTVGVTSIGMLGRLPGWIIPLGGPLTVLVAVGGITRKPGIIHNEVHPRDYLHITIAVDHDLIDGGPLARFVNRLTELVESAYQLP